MTISAAKVQGMMVIPTLTDYGLDFQGGTLTHPHRANQLYLMQVGIIFFYIFFTIKTEYLPNAIRYGLLMLRFFIG
jgi:hypothetical protein